MIDLHCHLLPGIDDGPDVLESSLAMARRAYDDGIRTVAATPHLRQDHPDVLPDELEDRVAVLQEALVEAEIPLHVVVGGEVDLFWAGRASDEELRLVSFGGQGRMLLIETPHGFLSDVFEDLLAEVVGRGFRVVLAHPERNRSLQQSLPRVRELVEEGIFIQINASSLANGGSDAEAHRAASQLLEKGWVHLVATDSHSPGPWRPPSLSSGYRAIEASNPAEARWLTEDVPGAILAGTAPAPRPRRPTSPRRLSWLSLLSA